VRIKAPEDLQSERVEQVKFGSVLEQDFIDSRAQLLQAKQELVTTDLQLSDLKLKLNDLIGLGASAEANIGCATVSGTVASDGHGIPGIALLHHSGTDRRL
jgi:outer membrane protein TolC